MGWGIMPEGSLEFTHKPCEICGKPVEAGQKFYFRHKKDVVHAGCAWKEEEERREGGKQCQKQKKALK